MVLERATKCVVVNVNIFNGRDFSSVTFRDVFSVVDFGTRKYEICGCTLTFSRVEMVMIKGVREVVVDGFLATETVALKEQIVKLVGKPTCFEPFMKSGKMVGETQL